MHELGHLIFHRKEYMRGAAEGRKKRKKDPKENAADKLAGEVRKAIDGKGLIP